MYFKYGTTEINALKEKDPILAKVIDQIGVIHREVNHDLFSSIVNSIVGQQISTKAHKTIWKRMIDALGSINADTILSTDIDFLQSLGMSYRKVEYIVDFAQKVKNKEIDLDHISQLSDKEIIIELSRLKGIGVWTAEMMLLFCLERPNVLSYDDLAILRGMRMVYHHRKITRSLFEKYRRRLSPYCSVASLYFWAVASGNYEGFKDYAPRKRAV
ncbi:MAG: DNA-3-methyladenine glycosylase 2 family protein [Anaerorhabdus sp.]|uniref:DNA-3-methyladenine glycosylase family protein n=1 Tax=Anaerorhabdus sp. TaxID=1872524 RepID=UPI002FCB09CA